VDIFIEAVNDSEIRLALLRAQPETMNQALQCAERERVILHGARRVGASFNAAQSNPAPMAAAVDWSDRSRPNQPNSQNYMSNNQSNFQSSQPRHSNRPQRGSSRGRGSQRGGCTQVRSESEVLEDMRQQLAHANAELSRRNTAGAANPHPAPTSGAPISHGRGGRAQRPNLSCWNCGGIGHYSRQCPTVIDHEEN
jgi:hypothetical protein